ncbi:CLUMA_CG017618, isoform A [Clunio marinus]|uniref:CLUMA_CG017618, isoform A n=1 Tax=Clunio marinus TaxID=568069 RepID=A0A1J1J117_9DIPT|nr:CLUMA_CG017618, isoform A [Clunio marinus]
MENLNSKTNPEEGESDTGSSVNIDLTGGTQSEQTKRARRTEAMKKRLKEGKGDQTCLEYAAKLADELNGTNMKIEKWVKNEINKRWNEASGLRHSKMMMKEPNTRRAKSLLNLSRNDLRVMMGVSTGHCCLYKHLNSMQRTQLINCRYCRGMTEETMKHVVASCDVHSRTRLRIFDHSVINAEGLAEVDLEDLLLFMTRTGVQTPEHFLRLLRLMSTVLMPPLLMGLKCD